MMNVSASHDSPRLSTSIFNKGMYKYRAKPSDNPDYKINKPDRQSLEEEKLLLVHQFTFPGAPQIWNGDEVGMWGADDPDCRKPMLWSDIRYEPERNHYFEGRERPVDSVYPDMKLREFYKKLIAMRHSEPALRRGRLQFFLADDSLGLLGYSRTEGDEVIYSIFNASGAQTETTVPLIGNEDLEVLIKSEGAKFSTAEDTLFVKMPARSFLILKKSQNE